MLHFYQQFMVGIHTDRTVGTNKGQSSHTEAAIVIAASAHARIGSRAWIGPRPKKFATKWRVADSAKILRSAQLQCGPSREGLRKSAAGIAGHFRLPSRPILPSCSDGELFPSSLLHPGR